MEYCTYIDPRAKAIGAVNTVVNKNGLLYGYNTDYLGFAHLCDAHGVDFAGRTVLILGTGGTHNTLSLIHILTLFLSVWPKGWSSRTTWGHM